MKGLTKRQKAIIHYIETFTEDHGVSPTVDEIAANFGIRSPTAFAHVRALYRKGYITRTSKARSITVLRSDKPKHLSLTLSIPVLGRISAGAPLLAEQNQEGTIQFDPQFLPKVTAKSPLFALRVFGDSMRDLGILDGDLVIARQCDTANIGDIVVAMYDNETTVKSFYITKGRAELRPANPDYESQFYDLDKIVIQGVVIALHRTL
jgi:repressor LexA